MIRFGGTLAKMHASGKAFLIALLWSVPGSAVAQMNLMGAGTGAPAHAPSAASTKSAPTRAAPVKAIPLQVPDAQSVLGHTLSLDGTKGAMLFEQSGNGVVLRSLVLTGERLSKPSESCNVTVVGAEPVAATSEGQPSGATRWSVPVPACRFAADVLDGAVLVTAPQATCDFVAADCRVSTIGLWGPSPDSISPQRIKEMERRRLATEGVMRGNFRVLLHRAGKDKDAVRAATSAQAAFSSEREMTCRDYSGEAVHGFCSAEITLARALAIVAQIGDGDDTKAAHAARPGKTREPGPHAKPARKTHPAATEPPPPQSSSPEPQRPASVPGSPR